MFFGIYNQCMCYKDHLEALSEGVGERGQTSIRLGREGEKMRVGVR